VSRIRDPSSPEERAPGEKRTRPASEARAVTPPTEVTLTLGEFAWLSIAQYLTKGNNLQAAISKANDDLDAHGPWTDQTNKKIVPTVPWMAIGNNADGSAGMNF